MVDNFPVAPEYYQIPTDIREVERNILDIGAKYMVEDYIEASSLFVGAALYDLIYTNGGIYNKTVFARYMPSKDRKFLESFEATARLAKLYLNRALSRGIGVKSEDLLEYEMFRDAIFLLNIRPLDRMFNKEYASARRYIGDVYNKNWLSIDNLLESGLYAHEIQIDIKHEREPIPSDIVKRVSLDDLIRRILVRDLAMQISPDVSP